ncbi:MAG TPA: thiamine pyrophosphate-binding protein [Planctomycetaceae bacterium]|nr:thiamine pyrophosphate-binding protein [Planctomycetaceae bacterium]
MERMLGGDAVARMLAAEGVRHVFGIIDGTYFGLYASLGKHGIQLISPRHEACAVHMAAAYARTTGRLGVCIASNGPGVANALPGVAVENGEGNRVMVLTSTRRTGIGYPDRGGTYQYFNQVGAIKAISKFSCAVTSPDRIVELMKRAFRIAYRGRPGVVHVDIPENILNRKQSLTAMPAPESYRRVKPLEPDLQLVRQAAELLVKAQLPLIHAGSGVVHAQASQELLRVAQLLHSPVVTSWAARGAIAETCRLSVPMIYVQLNNLVRNEADCVLTLGSRIGETDWWGKAPNWRQPQQQTHIQVDIDDEILGLNKPVNLAILSDVRQFLIQLAEELSSRQGQIQLSQRQAAVERYHQMQESQRAKLDDIFSKQDAPLTAAHAARVCQQVFKSDAYYVIDGGNTAVWGNFYHEIRTPMTVLGTPKFGMLGAGVAQALGAKIAHPDRQVYCLIGDGAMGFNIQEIETAVRNDLDVIYLVCCDKQWGMVKMNQSFTLRPIKTMIRKSLGPDETINADFSEMAFDRIAEAMGAFGQRVQTVEQLRPAIEQAVASKRCSVIHIDVDPVKHMWAPSLLEFKKMHEEPRGR